MRSPVRASSAATAVPTIPPPITATSAALARGAALIRCASPARPMSWSAGDGWSSAGDGRHGPRRGGTRARGRRDPAERVDETIDLRGRVVVGQPDPDDATVVEQPEPLDEPRRVEVAIPDRDALLPQGLRDGSGSDSLHPERGRGCPVGEPIAIRDAVEPEPRDRLQAVDKVRVQVHLVGPNR